jgi:Nif-specific regulatory protein
MAESAAFPGSLSIVGQSRLNSIASGRESRELDHAGEIRQLASLLEINKALATDLRLRAKLQQTLGILHDQHLVLGASVALVRETTRELHTEASVGLSESEERLRGRAGESVLSRVIETGRPIVVPEASREPALAVPASRSTEEITVFCIPIIVNHQASGALTNELPFKKDRDYERSLKFFSVVASMIAQAVKINRLLDAERRRLLDENVQLKEALQERYDFSNLIGNSGPMRSVYEQVTQVASTLTTVMLRGESGTGKELIAHAIHYNSPRKKNPFVKVNCAALPETLIESELFGYEKGAFTGAHSQKKGRFELAEGGTLFLDEIGEINSSTAVKLLRVLQEKQFERLGGTRTIRADVRLIVATNKDLEKAIASGTFREDLYYRLNVFAIFVPPLRERKSDVLLLAEHFLEKYSSRHGKNIKRISTPAIDMLMSYHWPGNVRELENTIERSVLVCDGNVIHGHHLPPTLQTAEASGTVMTLSFKEAVDAYERDLIQDTLKTTRGSRSKAANLLRTTNRVINYKIRKLNIDCSRFKR